MQKLEQLTTFLQLTQLDSIPSLQVLQQKTTLKPSILAVILAVFLILFSFLVDITPLITGIGCTIIPAYFTFQVIGTKIEREYIKYLVYWVCFGLTQILVEPIVGFVFGSVFVMIFELGVTVALLHPKFNFALIVYDRFVRVYILKQQAKPQAGNNSPKIQQSSKAQSQGQTQPLLQKAQ